LENDLAEVKVSWKTGAFPEATCFLENGAFPEATCFLENGAFPEATNVNKTQESTTKQSYS